MNWKSWILKLKNSITGQRSCQKLQKKSNKIKLRRLLGYVFLTSCVILHGTKSLLLLSGLSFFLTNDSLVTSYLQADLLGIPVIRPADIETIRPHPYELHANSGPTYVFYSISAIKQKPQSYWCIQVLFVSGYLFSNSHTQAIIWRKGKRNTMTNRQAHTEPWLNISII